MKQRSVALMSLIGGVIGFGLAGLIQLDRTLLTTPKLLPALPSDARVFAARIEKPAVLENKPPQAQVMHLDPIYITGSKLADLPARPLIPAAAPLFQSRPSAPASSPVAAPSPVAAALVVPDT